MREVGGGARLLPGTLLLLLRPAPAACRLPCCCCLPAGVGAAAGELESGAVRRCGRETDSIAG